MPSKDSNVSIKERKKQERSARRRAKDNFARNRMEKPFSDFFASDSEMTIDSSKIFINQSIEYTINDETEIRISDTEVYK